MKTKLQLFSIIFFSFIATKGFSQKIASDVIVNSTAPQQVKVDGKSTEWGDSLKYYNPQSKISYDLANDDQNIYLVIKSSDKQTTTKILVGGISFSVNINGKKKLGPTVTFPILDKAALRANPPQKSKPDSVQLRNQILSNIKEIKVSGMKEIVDGSISLQNEYGIRAAVGYDEKNNLIYELAVPLQQFELESSSENVLACNIKINGFTGPQVPNQNNNNPNYGNRGMYGGMYGNGMRYPSGYSNRNPLFQATDFWIKATLIKQNK
ncbi:hypothetical protein GS399_02825 [Pedobacter sp. HMF7647]|uniref:Uncharacterized protein n=1 Tax=Hufsiella arboris TaxID=2695275 RepID=A0A7K1Y621_9SPHI|nr:hypothetical protein [Hufsiella arboris]MXV49890.1 hypothetical protein [Hufsiella arboris]